MLIPVIGDFLPSAIAVALSPIPIVAVVVVLGGPSPRRPSLMFALGWVLGLLAVTLLVLLLTAGADDADSETSTVVDLVRIAVGLAFLAVALKTWRGRPQRGEDPEMPGWMASVEDTTPARSFVLGATLSGANPKNFALTATAVASISEAGLEGAQVAVAAGAFVVLGSVTVLGAVLAHLVAAERTAAPLAAVKSFMVHYSAVILMVIALVLGAKILGDGLAGLFGPDVNGGASG